MKTTFFPFVLAGLLGIASAAGATPRAASSGALNQPTASSGVPGIATTSANDDEVCTCTATYADGSEQEVDACSRSECPDLDTYLACRDAASTGVMPIGGCALLETCECTCRATEQETTRYFERDVHLAGVPNLWQFDYGCGAFGRNAVGCGPVAASMIMYWWAQQGFEGLVSGFVSGTGSSPVDRDHDWQAMVRDFRDNYLNGGICIAGQYAVQQGKLRDGIAEYIADAGYDASVEHVKVCNDCNHSGSDELLAASGLRLILDELYAGRPVVMGFNVMRAQETSGELGSGNDAIAAYTGELSNDAAGVIDHYAVITGYRRIDDQDVLIVNTGWKDSEDVAYLWNVGGKWLHLYTIDIEDAPDGDDYCSIDRTCTEMFLADTYLDPSNDWGSAPYEVLAGRSCGIHREYHDHAYYPEWTEVSFECDPYAGYGDIEPFDPSEHFGGSDDTGAGHETGGFDVGSNAPVLDPLLPR